MIVSNGTGIEDDGFKGVGGQSDRLRQAHDSQVIQIGGRDVAIMRINVTNLGKHPSGRGNKDIIVAEDDAEPRRMGQTGAICHTVGGRQYMPIIDQDATAVDLEGRIDGAIRRILARNSRYASADKRSDFFLAEDAWKYLNLLL